MKPKVFIAKAIPEVVENYIAEHCEIKKWDGEFPVPREVLLQELSDVEGLLISGGSIDEEFLSSAPNLKIVSNSSVGYNNFDLDAMERHHVIGTNTPEVLDETVADLTFALILASARRIAELDHHMREGKWGTEKDEKQNFGIDVHSKTLGIIGMGRIGKAIAKRAKYGFGMDLLYHNRNRRPDAEEEFGAVYCKMETLLQESDFVVLLTPLTAETFHLIGEKEFGLMKKSAIFINVSRGQTVDGQALIYALQNGEIYGAGLDVFTKEPIEAENPLLGLSNVVVVPHIGSATEQTRSDMAMRAAENLVSVLTGGKPIDRVI